MIYLVAVFAPLVGAMISGLLGRAIGDRAAQGASILGMVVAAICGPLAFFQLVNGDLAAGVVPIATWIEPGRSTSTGRCATTRCRRSWWRWSRSSRC